MRLQTRSRCLAAVVACVSACAAPDHGITVTPGVDSTVLADYSGVQSVAATFQLLGGYRLDAQYASEGLALVRDANGFVVEAVGGAHVYTNSLNVYDLRTPIGTGSDVNSYPLLTPGRNWPIGVLFPRMITGQTIRDVAVRQSAGGYEIGGIGRVFYNTAPRPTTQINVRELLTNGTTLGRAYEIPVDLPEQEFSGFIKHPQSRVDFEEIGAGAYDSGQGSVGGLSYAIQQTTGSWRRLLSPPSFGDITSPRLPRDANYSCPGGASWVCIPPVNGVGVWSTERIGGGGVKYGDNVMFIATLGYGPRTYAQQSYTFGDPNLDQAVAYFFRRDRVTNVVTFVSYGTWTYASAGQLVIGTAVGRLRGNPDLLLFVTTRNGWNVGQAQIGAVLQIFRINAVPGSR